MNEEIGMDFYCKIGDVETTVPWDRPTLEAVKSWYKEWKTTPGLENYEVYLTGNFAEITFGVCPLDTWDVDVVLVGEIKDNREFKNITNEAVRIGFKHRVLIDIFNNDVLIDIGNFYPFKQTRGFQHFHKRRFGEVEDYYVEGDRVTELEGGLWEIDHTVEPKSFIKAQKRLKSGEYQGIQKLISNIW